MECLSNGIIAKYWCPVEEHPDIDRFVDELIKVTMDSFVIIGYLKKVETIQKNSKEGKEFFKQITVIVNEITAQKATSSIQIPDNKKEFMYIVDFDYAPAPVLEETDADFEVGDTVTLADGKIEDVPVPVTETKKTLTPSDEAAVLAALPETETKPEDADKFEDDDFDKIFEEMEANGEIDADGTPVEVNETVDGEGAIDETKKDGIDFAAKTAAKKAEKEALEKANAAATPPKKAESKPGPGSDLYTVDPDESFEDMFGDDDEPANATATPAPDTDGEDEFNFDDPATVEKDTTGKTDPVVTDDEFNFDEFDKDGDPDFSDKTAPPAEKTETPATDSVPGLDFSDELDDDDLDFS